MDTPRSFITAQIGPPLNNDTGLPEDPQARTVQVRDSGAGDGSFTIRGHAAVFNKLSLDLGGFQEQLAPGAFRNALSGNPDVLAVWDHDTRYVLARTLNNTLELREDPYGLHSWMRVAPTSYATDLRVLMERGDITQASFMFTIEREKWEITERADGTEQIIATVEEVGELFDVTVTGRGAYPQTDMSVVQGRSHRLTNALQEGRVPGLSLDQAQERGLVPVLGQVTETPERAVTPDDGSGPAIASTGGTAQDRERLLARAKAQRAVALRP